ncbi:LysE family translocator [Proteiniphilum sp. UBA1028]|jgi:threonine/homoserine/homoserine lactone efflux protein|uniref:LysE family translocator n=1 Tax=Proteiniphilum sp. UBA1028 TaxID=1947251 RepID=UPI000E94A2AF|nr:LysE family translocator [Proteiniphilum sp. UBA1028]HBG56545.1 lysine transporter LysE [Porphyromonadaceae bacterium]
MLETIAKGFLIGLLVSSPMGPINMLTIQRTLNRGWWHGFVTGLGSVLSDFIYAVITLAGLGLVSDFLAAHEGQLQLLGSLILIFFGVGVFRSNPLRDWQPDRISGETRYAKDFISAFLLTLSNVAIILVFVGLYARFSFNPFQDGPASLFAGLISFAAAALLWWFLLTTFVSRLRKHFNRRGLILLNRTIGILLMVVGAGGILLSVFPV